jgi:translation initiation factor 1 (eIF-1/SUI1)
VKHILQNEIDDLESEMKRYGKKLKTVSVILVKNGEYEKLVRIIKGLMYRTKTTRDKNKYVVIEGDIKKSRVFHKIEEMGLAYYITEWSK